MQANARSVSAEPEQPEEPKRSADPSTLFRKMGQMAAQGEQAVRLEKARGAAKMNRLWGILQAKTGGTLYKIVMNSDLSDEDKQFIKETKTN